MFKKTTLLSFALAATVGLSTANAQSMESAGTFVGLGQDSAREPSKIRNLRLSDPLVQQKYLNEPDMLRFLRGSYSEACTRGTVLNATKQVHMNLKKEYPPEAREVAARLIEANRIWKMSSFELEALVGKGYLTAANYCDCLMKEVPDTDLVNPRKGLEVIEKIPQNVRNACQTNAEGLAEKQLNVRKKIDEEKKKSK